MNRDDKLTYQEAKNRIECLRLEHTELKLSLTSRARRYTGSVNLHFELLRPGPVPALDSAVEKIGSVQIDGQSIDFESSGHRLQPAGEYEAGHHVLQLDFDTGFSNSGLGMHYFKDPADDCEYIYTDLEPYECHTVFPCWDQPDMKAPLKLRASLPEEWAFSANEPVHSLEVEGGLRQLEFETTPPMSPYVFCLIAGDYHVVEGPRHTIPMRVFVRQSLTEYLQAEMMMELSVRSIAWMENEFQTPYPYSKHDQVFVPEYTMGAMENPGVVTFNELYLFRQPPSRRQKMDFHNTIVHELVHMWFGNLVTMRWWGDLWLNESFATLSPYLCLKELGDYPDCDAVFTDEVMSSALTEDENSTSHPVIADCPDTHFAQLNFDRITYEKGACVLHQLIHRIGRPTYQKAVQVYLERHRFSNTDDQDWLRVLEEISDLDTEAFARDFWHSRGLNTHELQHSRKDLRLIQKPDCHEGRIRRQRVLIRCFQPDSKGNVTCEEEWDGMLEGEVTSVFHNLPDGGFAIPNCGGFGLGRFHLDPEHVELVLKHYDRLEFEDRHAAVISLCSMLESSLIDPRRLIDFILQNLAAETEPLQVEMLEYAWIMATHHMLPRSREPKAFQQGLDCSVSELKRYAPGSERALRWLDLAVRFLIPDGQDASRLFEVFTQDELAGHPLHRSHRYTLATRICACYHPQSDEVVEALQKRDQDDASRKDIHTLKSLLRVDKRKLLMEVLDSERKESADWIRSEMAALFSRYQKHENLELVVPWFDALPFAFGKRDTTYCDALIAVSFPRCHESLALTMVQKMLEQKQMTVALKRRLKETSEHLMRYRRIRERYFGEEN